MKERLERTYSAAYVISIDVESCLGGYSRRDVTRHGEDPQRLVDCCFQIRQIRRCLDSDLFNGRESSADLVLQLGHRLWSLAEMVEGRTQACAGRLCPSSHDEY